MARIGIGLALVAALGWFLFGRGGEVEAVTNCMEKAGATVEESPHFAQLFPYAMALGEMDRVKSYPELDKAHIYSVRYGDDRALLFVGDNEDGARQFESLLSSLAASGGMTLPSRRAGKLLLVWTAPAAPGSVDDCIR